MAPMEAIKASFELVKENVGAMIVFLLLSWVVISPARSLRCRV